MNNKPYGYCVQMTHISKKRVLRMYLFELATYIGAKLNLINVIRFPRTAVLEYKDICWIFDKELK